ncbi:hypothetical protein NQ317_011777 [Molorchus minor]|uniref:CWH43-like N-terminal domain-containing protein n=1 Tax=Molorchus minor TaxID=1323400 RepID=A0ABQ9JHJ2_9CUCU|nr:hypothetical protein NQ317_011777 [Molorchus minor]
MRFNCFKFQLHYFPIITALWFTLTYLVVYIVAVLLKHVDPLFPYISVAGTHPPESCIFGFMLNIATVLMFIVIYVRYQQLKFCPEIEAPKYLNNLSFTLGILACLGVTLVANFQESNVISVHALGALFAFGCSTMYCCIQAWLTWRSNASLTLKLFRLLLCFVLISTFLNDFIFAPLARKEYNGTSGTDMTNWKWQDGGYIFYLTATFSEWILAMTLNLYIFSMEREFKMIRFEDIVFTKNV